MAAHGVVDGGVRVGPEDLLHQHRGAVRHSSTDRSRRRTVGVRVLLGEDHRHVERHGQSSHPGRSRQGGVEQVAVDVDAAPPVEARLRVDDHQDAVGGIKVRHAANLAPASSHSPMRATMQRMAEWIDADAAVADHAHCRGSSHSSRSRMPTSRGGAAA